MIVQFLYLAAFVLAVVFYALVRLDDAKDAEIAKLRDKPKKYEEGR